MIVTIPGKVAKAVEKFRSTEESRPTLNNVLIRGGHIIATNGHVLAKAPLFEDPDHRITGLTPEYPEHPDWYIPGDTLKRMKVSEYLVIDLVTGAVETRSLKRVITGEPGPLLATLPRMDRENGTRYPDVDQVIPKSDPVARVRLSTDYLKRAAALAESYGWDSITFELTDGVVENDFDTANRAVRLSGPKPGDPFVGLIMPLRRSR
jgi:hypothetical protein